MSLPRSSRTRRAITLVMAAWLTLLSTVRLPANATTSPEPADEYRPAPATDPFYRQPSPLPRLAPGTIIDSRPITFTPAPVAAMPWFAAWHLKFISTGEHGEPIAAVATVVKPLAARLNASPSRLVSLQIPYNSLGTECSVSHSYAGGTAHPTYGIFAPLTLAALSLGWTVVLPDHLGPESAYLAPRIAAHITLDAVRAAERFHPLGLDGQNTPVGLWGFSGGSPGTLWAAGQADEYAPDVDIVGVAAGGLVVHPELVLRNLDGDPVFFRYSLAVMIGLARVYPTFFPPEMLSAKGRATVAAMKDGCDGGTTDGSLPRLGHYADYTLADPLSTPGARAMFESTTLPQPGVTPRAPTYLFHATADEAVPISAVEALAETWCDDGADVLVHPLPGIHYTAGVLGGTLALEFLRHTFAGSTFSAPTVNDACA